MSLTFWVAYNLFPIRGKRRTVKSKSMKSRNIRARRPVLKITKEQGGHCGYFMDPIMLSQ